MFTGIIEYQGRVIRRQDQKDFATLTLDVGPLARGMKAGDSLAVNGVCLTVTRRRGRRAVVDVMQETLRCTTLGQLRPGDAVNCERPLTPQSRFGGHFVTGHVDAVGTLKKKERAGRNTLMTVAASPRVTRFMVPKGSVALDGISLTLGRVRKKDFDVHLIPHTLKVTTLGEKKVGDALNIEIDLLAKYVKTFKIK